MYTLEFNGQTYEYDKVIIYFNKTCDISLLSNTDNCVVATFYDVDGAFIDDIMMQVDGTDDYTFINGTSDLENCNVAVALPDGTAKDSGVPLCDLKALLNLDVHNTRIFSAVFCKNDGTTVAGKTTWAIGTKKFPFSLANSDFYILSLTDGNEASKLSISASDTVGLMATYSGTVTYETVKGVECIQATFIQVSAGSIASVGTASYTA